MATKSLQNDNNAGNSFRAGIVLYTGKEVLPMGENLWAMPISTLWHG